MMSTIRLHKIEVDEEVYNFLKKNAEPFKDTPNSVLRRFLPLKSGKIEAQDNNFIKGTHQFPESVPNALAQILEMIVLVKNQGLSRVEATHRVADRRGITTQSVIDKYTRQLGKKAYEVDELLISSNIHEFKTLLIELFPRHSRVIESTLEGIR
jgi:negative regulator of replication initiation